MTTHASTSTPAVRLSAAIALPAIVVLAAALRFYELGSQSLWLDESFTAAIVDGSFGHVLSTVPETESTPHLYYLLESLWTQVFGTGEAGLRSLSAIAGIATVPVAFLAARELWDERAGLFAAALVAVNPYLVWYSQEARSYALLVLLSTLSVWLWARALSDPTGRRVATWAAVGVLALATHYFAAFLLVPEAAYLLFRLRSRAAALGIGAIALAGAVLAPLALHQRASGSTTFIKDIALGSRVTSLPKKFVTGELGTPTAAIGALAALAVVAGVVALLVRGDARERRGGALVLGLAALTVLIPLVLAALGFDYLLPRNVLPAYALVALVAGAGMAVAGRAGLALAVLVAAVAVFVDVQVTRDTTLQRDDWRGAAEVLGPPPPSGARAVVVTSAPQRKALEHYAGAMRPLPPGGAAVAEIDVIGNARPPRYATPPLPPGFALFQHRRSDSWELYRYRATAPATVAPAALAQSRLGTKDAAILVQTTGSEGGRR